METREKSLTEGFTKPAITRIARRAGVKSMSDDCTETIRNIIGIELDKILRTALIINSERQTKTIMPDDIYRSLAFYGYNVAQSEELSTTACPK